MSATHSVPSGELKFLTCLAVFISIVCLVAALKFQFAPVPRDETATALGLGLLVLGIPFSVLGIFAFGMYSKKWRLVFVAPIAIYIVALGISLM
jgi:hypothetical protein